MYSNFKKIERYCFITHIMDIYVVLATVPRASFRGAVNLVRLFFHSFSLNRMHLQTHTHLFAQKLYKTMRSHVG